MFSPDGRSIAVTDRTLGGMVRLWDPKAGEETFSIGFQSRRARGAVAFTPDGSLLAVGEEATFKPMVKVWRLRK